jgi:apolipoprotein N-acyltransferase
MGDTLGYASLVLFWMSFEFIHLNWELSWPWLTLGNVFSTHPDWVQWYEYTGTSGGTFWVVCTNLLIFFSMRKGQGIKVKNKYGLGILLIFIIPFGISYMISKEAFMPDGDKFRNIVIVQPNVDPWNEKFVAGSEQAQVHDLIRLSEVGMDPNTALVIWPETAIPNSLNEDSLKSTFLLQPVWDFMKKHPDVNLLTGIEGYRIFTEQNKTINSQKIQNTPYYFESYNSSALMDSNRFQVYHKSRLVPGAETLPSFIHFLASWFEKFGGTTGSYVRQTDRTVLTSYNHSYKIAPAICYESIYGEFIAEYIKRGATIIAIETNDGWWGDTPGYKQHESYARLRAIETRRWVVRSANTGISCFINPKGTVIDPQPWNKKSVIRLDVPVMTGITFFVKHGDILSRIAIGVSILLIFWNLFVFIRGKLHRG